MNGWLLDTNVPSEITRAHPDHNVLRWVRSQPDTSLFLSAVTAGELRRGFCLLPEGRRRLRLEHWLDQERLPLFNGRLLAVTGAVPERWAVLSAQRQLAGRPLGMADGLIAATALEHNLILATRNTRDFEGLGLDLLNPWQP